MEGFNDWEKRLKRIEKNLANEVAPKIRDVFKETVSTSLTDWYADYSRRLYKRTFNFLSVLDSVKVKGNGNLLSLSVDSGYMSSYPGFRGQSLQPSTAFDYMFINGEHGHGDLCMHVSFPPYSYIDNAIQHKFEGRTDHIIDDVVGRILQNGGV